MVRLSQGWAGATYPWSAGKLTSEFWGIWVLLPKLVFFWPNLLPCFLLLSLHCVRIPSPSCALLVPTSLLPNPEPLTSTPSALWHKQLPKRRNRKANTQHWSTTGFRQHPGVAPGSPRGGSTAKGSSAHRRGCLIWVTKSKCSSNGD